MKPMIIITQTVVAAAARRDGATRFAITTSNVVPQAPTPIPINTKAAVARAIPAKTRVSIQAVASAAPKPPSPSKAMPPTMKGVLRPPASHP